MNRIRFTLILLCSLLAGSQLAAQTQTLTQAELVLGSTMPEAGAVWIPVTLPYVFTPADYRISREGWFRIRPGDLSSVQTPGLLFPKVNMNIEIFLNGTLIGDGGSFSEPVARNWNRPLLFSLPERLLTGNDELLVHLISYPPFGQLGLVESGETESLRAQFDRIRWNNNSSTEIMFYITFVAGLWGLMLWLQRPRDSINLWYSLAAICWSLYSLNLFIETIPVSAHLWDSIQFSSTDVLAVLVTGFIHRLLKIRRPVFEAVIICWALLGLAVNLSVDMATMASFMTWWHLGAIGLVFYMTYLVIRHYSRLDRQSRGALVLFFICAIIVSIHDLLYQAGYTWLVLPWRLFPYPAPILLVFFFWLLVKRFVLAMNEAESLSRELDQRVEQNREELEKSYRELQNAETFQAIEQERQSIQNRFHEEVGGTLQLLSQSRQHRVSEAITEVMHSLRQALGDHMPSRGELPLILAKWEKEIVTRLAARKIKLTWNARGLAAGLELQRSQRAHLHRILNEAVTNAIKHGNPHQVVISWEYKNPQLELRIEDRGAPRKLTIVPGRGVLGMENRTRNLGGSIRWYPSSTGCLVLLTLPCYHPADTQSAPV